MRDSMSPASDKRNCMITYFIKKVKNMAESGGHDPHSAKLNDAFIGRSPILWDSLSSHHLIISGTKTFTTCSLLQEIPPHLRRAGMTEF